MFRMIKIVFNAFILVLAIIGFNAIGGQKYVEIVKENVTNFIQKHAQENMQKIGNFSNLHEEFQIDNSVNLLGYKAVIAEHKASEQKMCIIDSGKKALLTASDIKNPDLEKALPNQDVPIILLSHTPDIFEKVPESVNLTLAGHVHGGQVKLPKKGAILVPSKFGTKYAEGFFNDMGRKMLVSKGVGTSILPIRFLCPPEIVVIEFVD